MRAPPLPARRGGSERGSPQPSLRSTARIRDGSAGATPVQARRSRPASTVVGEHFTPQALPSYGLGYEDLKAIRPDLILCSIAGCGQMGPLAEHVSNDTVGQAMSGMASLTVDDRSYPVEAGNGVGDSAARHTCRGGRPAAGALAR